MKLLTKQNAKTIKGEKLGYETFILYLAPHKQNTTGKNLCASASEGCIKACLYTAGRGKMSNVQTARMNKANMFVEERDKFLAYLYSELMVISKSKKNLTPCIRLNGTSDILWENIKFNGKTMMEHFPDLQLYDYSKHHKRVINNTIPNYHLTFSRSESNHELAKEVLEAGKDIAVVVTEELKNTILDKYTNGVYIFTGYNMIDGDDHDLTFIHPKYSILLLKAKGDATKDDSGFVIKDLKTFESLLW